MTEKTLRRKAQKKVKRKKYKKCACGYLYSVCTLKTIANMDTIEHIPTSSCYRCGLVVCRPWVGGGTGRRIPK